MATQELLLVTATDVSKGLVLWRLLLEYISLIILRKIVRMCEQCVPGRIFRPGNGAITSFLNKYALCAHVHVRTYTHVHIYIHVI